MNILLLILLLLITVACIYYWYYNKHAVYIKTSDNQYYLVKRNKNSSDAAELLSQIRVNIRKLSDYANKRSITTIYHKYMNNLYNKTKNIKIIENIFNNNYTSYSVEKGEELVFCLRSKVNDQLHDINLLMYVVIHELSHIACPEYGHTQLFKQIFQLLATYAVELKLYTIIPFNTKSQEYCGINITDSII